MPKVTLIKDNFHDLKILLNGTMAVEKKSINQIARAMGVMGRSIYQYLKYPERLTLSKLLRLSQLLGVPIDTLRQVIRY